jgi:hypothetical protein
MSQSLQNPLSNEAAMMGVAQLKSHDETDQPQSTGSVNGLLGAFVSYNRR